MAEQLPSSVDDLAASLREHAYLADRGLATVLIAQALSTTRADGLRIVAVCPMVAHYVSSHHDFDDIVDPVTPEILQWLSPGV